MVPPSCSTTACDVTGLVRYDGQFSEKQKQNENQWIIHWHNYHEVVKFYLCSFMTFLKHSICIKGIIISICKPKPDVFFF